MTCTAHGHTVGAFRGYSLSARSRPNKRQGGGYPHWDAPQRADLGDHRHLRYDGDDAGEHQGPTSDPSSDKSIMLPDELR